MPFNVNSLLIKGKEWLFWQPLGIIWEDEVQAYLHNCKCTVWLWPCNLSSSLFIRISPAMWSCANVLWTWPNVHCGPNRVLHLCPNYSWDLVCVLWAAWWVTTVPVGRSGERWGCGDDTAAEKCKVVSVKLLIHQSPLEPEALEGAQVCWWLSSLTVWTLSCQMLSQFYRK